MHIFSSSCQIRYRLSQYLACSHQSRFPYRKSSPIVTCWRFYTGHLIGQVFVPLIKSYIAKQASHTPSQFASDSGPCLRAESFMQDHSHSIANCYRSTPAAATESHCLKTGSLSSLSYQSCLLADPFLFPLRSDTPQIFSNWFPAKFLGLFLAQHYMQDFLA